MTVGSDSIPRASGPDIRGGETDPCPKEPKGCSYPVPAAITVSTSSHKLILSDLILNIEHSLIHIIITTSRGEKSTRWHLTMIRTCYQSRLRASRSEKSGQWMNITIWVSQSDNFCAVALRLMQIRPLSSIFSPLFLVVAGLLSVAALRLEHAASSILYIQIEAALICHGICLSLLLNVLGFNEFGKTGPVTRSWDSCAHLNHFNGYFNRRCPTSR